MRLIIELIILVLCLGAAAYVWFKRPAWCISKQVKRDEEITGKNMTTTRFTAIQP